MATKTQSGRPIGIPVYYPTKLVPGAEFLTDATNGDTLNTHGFVIDGGGGHAYYGYKIVAEIPFGTAGYSYSDYFGFSGTNWRDAPILANPTEEKTINGHDLPAVLRQRAPAPDRLADRPGRLLGRERPARDADHRPDARAWPSR